MESDSPCLFRRAAWRDRSSTTSTWWTLLFRTPTSLWHLVLAQDGRENNANKLGIELRWGLSTKAVIDSFQTAQTWTWKSPSICFEKRVFNTICCLMSAECFRVFLWWNWKAFAVGWLRSSHEVVRPDKTIVFVLSSAYLFRCYAQDNSSTHRSLLFAYR